MWNIIEEVITDTDVRAELKAKLLADLNSNIPEGKHKTDVELVHGNNGSYVPSAKFDTVQRELDTATAQKDELADKIKNSGGESEELKVQLKELADKHKAELDALESDKADFIKSSLVSSKLRDLGIKKGLNILTKSVDLGSIVLDKDGNPTNIDTVIEGLKANEEVGFLMENEIKGAGVGAGDDKLDPNKKLNELKTLETQKTAAVEAKDAQAVSRINMQIGRLNEK